MLPRRKKLIVVYAALGLGLTIAAAAVVLFLQRGEPADAPGAPREGITSDLARDLPGDRPSAVFTDVTVAAGIDFQHFAGGVRSTQLPEDMGSGVAWGDVDGDGYPDLFLVSGAKGGHGLYRNRGDGSFENVTEASGLAGDPMVGMGAAFGDYDGDGRLDLVVTGFDALRLYRNLGEGRFLDASREGGLDRHRGFWAGASWGDYDGDGDLDLYVTGYVRYAFRAEDAERGTRQYQAVVPFTLNPSSYPPERNLLLRNEGKSGFRELAESAGVANPEGRSLAASWCDFDEDGDLDLYVANDVSDNALFENRGDGSFDDVSHAAWVADYRGAMGLAVGDWDGDLDQDLFVTHWIAQENALYSNLRYAFDSDEPSEGLRFMDVADMVGLGQVALDYVGWGTFFFDYDNDGRADLFVANGSTFQKDGTPSELVPMRDQLFWNAGPERGFYDVASASGEALTHERVSRGAAMADFDRDGDLDVLVVHHGERPSLLRNDGGNESSWLDVAVRSGGENRFGVGAKVTVRYGDVSQTSHIGCQASYLSQSPLEVHFGLGAVDRVDELRVLFPGGKVLVQKGVAARQRVVVEESQGQ